MPYIRPSVSTSSGAESVSLRDKRITKPVGTQRPGSGMRGCGNADDRNAGAIGTAFQTPHDFGAKGNPITQKAETRLGFRLFPIVGRFMEARPDSHRLRWRKRRLPADFRAVQRYPDTLAGHFETPSSVRQVSYNQKTRRRDERPFIPNRAIEKFCPRISANTREWRSGSKRCERSGF